MGIIGPDGSFSQANAREFGAAAERAAASGKWTVDPAGMPAALMPAWKGALKKPRAEKAVQTEIQKKKQRAADKAHKSALDKMPEKKFDPWAKVR